MRPDGGNRCRRRTCIKDYWQRNCESNAKDEVRRSNWTTGSKLEMIVASGEIGVKAMLGLCRHVLDGKEMLDE